ncbi:hypothetical protein K8U54_17810 [Pseudomonas fulva]|uniref:hypothetical protein n=1 Tax=Pseudomonas fulva TaxID=47880 RepID=UPI00201E34AC|nr:hypothetical protein [Pseudomonas fulva]UQY33560.1 hypothetical protein K8U54_17810 [Pseudomonas fulva]
MATTKANDEYKPKCPKCGGINFAAVHDRYLHNADKSIALIVCADESCEVVVAALPNEAVWDS